MKNIPDSFCIFFPISESDPLLFSHFQFKEAPFQSIWETVCEGLFQSPFPGLRDPTQLQSPTDQRQACLCLNTFPSLLPASYVHSAVEAAGVCVCVCVHTRVWACVNVCSMRGHGLAVAMWFPLLLVVVIFPSNTSCLLAPSVPLAH